LRESAAKRGDPAAQNAMGVHYQLQGDRSTAEMWYRRASEQGSPAARWNLAHLARADANRAQLTATVLTAETGDAAALYELAQRYHRGEGVPPDYPRALRLYRAAAAQGSEPARQMLGLILSHTDAAGNVDPAWMRQLASTPPAISDRKALDPVQRDAVAAPRDDDPLSGLLALSVPRGAVSAPIPRRIP
jgi:TPR repeat protein